MQSVSRDNRECEEPAKLHNRKARIAAQAATQVLRKKKNKTTRIMGL